jgi:hypothetical protein
MSISAMKQALEALEEVQRYDKTSEWFEKKVSALRQAIAEAEKQEPVAVKHMMDWVYQLKRFSNDGRYMSIPSGLSAGACYELAVEIEQFIKTAPVHASDISQERVDETAKRKHEPVAWREVAGKTTQYYDYNEDGRGEPLYLHREWVGLDGDIPGLGLVTEEFYNGMLCAEDILRRRNT